MTTYNYQNIVISAAHGDVIGGGINDEGKVSGSFVAGAGGLPYPQAFTLTNGHHLVALAEGPGGQHSNGNGLNNLSDLAIQSGQYKGHSRAWLHTQNGYEYVSATPDVGDATALDVNDKNEVVGSMNPHGLLGNVPGTLGFIWKSGTITQLISFPGSTWTTANGIADTDTVVGTWGNGTTEQPFVEAGGHMQTINVPGAVTAEANGISSDGKEIVGTFQDSTGANHGWIDLAGHIEQFNIPGATATFIYDVNDFGQVDGAYTVAGDPLKHAFVATPASERLPGGALPLPDVVQQATGLKAGSLYYDPHQPVIAGVLTS